VSVPAPSVAVDKEPLWPDGPSGFVRPDVHVPAEVGGEALEAIAPLGEGRIERTLDVEAIEFGRLSLSGLRGLEAASVLPIAEHVGHEVTVGRRAVLPADAVHAIGI